VDRTVTPEAVALTVADWLVVTVPAVAVKLAVVEPALTVTDDGTLRRLLDELMATGRLVVDALVNVSTQLEALPDANVDGEQASDDNPADATRLRLVVTDDAATVRAPLEIEFNDALTCAVESEVSEPTCAAKLMDVLPLRIVTVVGTVTSEELLARETSMPLPETAFDKVTMQSADDPDETADGEQLTDESVIWETSVSVVFSEAPFSDAVT
jgi:hypothetical protein